MPKWQHQSRFQIGKTKPYRDPMLLSSLANPLLPIEGWTNIQLSASPHHPLLWIWHFLLLPLPHFAVRLPSKFSSVRVLEWAWMKL